MIKWQEFFKGLFLSGHLRYRGVKSAEIINKKGIPRRININDTRFIRCVDKLLPVVEARALGAAPLERFVITMDEASATILKEDPDKFAAIFMTELLRQQLSIDIVLSNYIAGPPVQLEFMRGSPSMSTPP